MPLTVVILAAGQGTRMKSARPKVIHELAGKPILHHVVETSRALGPDQIIVVLAHKDWADFIISAAKAHDLPIIALEHFGPHELPDELRQNADKVVGWNSRTIEDAIRMAARHDDTKRFDTIEFDLS